MGLLMLRRTPLRRYKPLRARTVLRRTKALKPGRPHRIPQRVADEVTLRASGRCEICGRPGLEMHHRRRRAQGGKDSPENLLLLCRECHDFIHHNPAWAYERGYLLRGYGEVAA
ncbi:MAG TPA: HNH endonuclease signature motif containing protein [Trueperaceae bacterium]